MSLRILSNRKVALEKDTSLAADRSWWVMKAIVFLPHAFVLVAQSPTLFAVLEIGCAFAHSRIHPFAHSPSRTFALLETHLNMGIDECFSEKI